MLKLNSQVNCSSQKGNPAKQFSFTSVHATYSTAMWYKSTAIKVKWQNLWLQQIRTSPNATATNKETKKKKSGGRNLQQERLPLHCQPLHEVWERVDPGSSPSNQLHCVHLSSPGLALPSHQVCNHCFRLRLSISMAPWYKSSAGVHWYKSTYSRGMRQIALKVWLLIMRICKTVL